MPLKDNVLTWIEYWIDNLYPKLNDFRLSALFLNILWISIIMIQKKEISRAMFELFLIINNHDLLKTLRKTFNFICCSISCTSLCMLQYQGSSELVLQIRSSE